MDLTEQNVLDLTDPAVAAKWNFVSGVSSESECQAIGAEAQSEGYNVIKVQSYRGSGINYIIFNGFGNILQARNVTPID